MENRIVQNLVQQLRRIAAQTALAALVIAGGFGASLVVAPQATPVAAAARQACPDPQERAFLRQINSYRKKRGLTQLVVDTSLMRAAHAHSVDMTKVSRVTGHNMRGGITPRQNFRKHGYPVNGAVIGENLAMGTSRDSGAEAFDAWQGSSTHNRTMLDGRFQAIGIARVYDANSTYGWYWTTTFGSVVDTRPKC